MKISLEFENMEKFFNELPRFAALVGFSGQFATFSHVKKPETVPSLDEPELPTVTQDASGITITATANHTPEENAAKLDAAAKVSNATKDALHIPRTDIGDKPFSDAMASKSTDKAPEKAEAVNSPAEEEKPETDPTETPQEASSEVKDTDVRAALNKLIKGGKRDKVSEILKEFGAKNFSGLKAKDYAAVVEKAKEAANG